MGRVERMQGWKRYRSQYLLLISHIVVLISLLNFLATDTINLIQFTVVNFLSKVRSFLRWILQGGKDAASATTMKKISGMLKNGKVGKLILLV